MTGISIDNIVKQVLAENALHYLTSDEPVKVLTEDIKDALREIIVRIWNEIMVQCGSVISETSVEDDIIGVEFTENISPEREKRIRMLSEGILIHKTLACVYGMSHSSKGVYHAEEGEKLRIMLGNETDEKGGVVIADGI